MGDLLYLLGIIVFFATMLAYVRGVRRLGQNASHEEESR
jgi:hypothetical protein